MRVNMSFTLEDKMIGDVKVAGLGGLWIDSKSHDIRRQALLFIENIASPLAVVGFADDDAVGFYKACEWLVGGKHYDDAHPQGEWLVASDSIDESKFEGELW